MNRDHNVRCVMAAVAAGGRPCKNVTARRILRDMCGVDADSVHIIRDGPVRPIYKNDWNYYIPYRYRGFCMEAAAGDWADEIREEERSCTETAK